MNTPHYSSIAAKLLQRHTPKSRPVPGDWERGVATIELAMRARARRRGWYVAAGALAAAAAALLVGARVTGQFDKAALGNGLIAIEAVPSGRGAAIGAGESAHALVERATLAAGQHLETASEGGASLSLSTGTTMRLAGSTAFRVDSQGALERFSLQRGEVSAHVAKLKSGQRFVIATPDAEVEVRGTQFRLSVLEQGAACGNGTRTRLEVSEGVVEVREAGQSVLVHAGGHWPAECLTSPPATAQPAASAPAVARERPGLPGRPVASVARVTEPERDSSLTAPNDLFQEGVALRRQGDTSGALRAYQALLTRFPGSPLAENALAERMRLLAKTGDARAAGEARRYLARFPRGFAANEARAIADEP